MWLSENRAMLDELAAALDNIRIPIRDLDKRIGDACDSFLVRMAQRLYRFGFRLQGEE